MSKEQERNVIQVAVGLILAVAALVGFIFTLIACGANGPGGGASPLILLPYAIAVIAAAAYFLLRDFLAEKDKP